MGSYGDLTAYLGCVFNSPALLAQSAGPTGHYPPAAAAIPRMCTAQRCRRALRLCHQPTWSEAPRLHSDACKDHQRHLLRDQRHKS